MSTACLANIGRGDDFASFTAYPHYCKGLPAKTGHWHMSGIGQAEVLNDLRTVKHIDYVGLPYDFTMSFDTFLSANEI